MGLEFPSWCLQLGLFRSVYWGGIEQGRFGGWAESKGIQGGGQSFVIGGPHCLGAWVVNHCSTNSNSTMVVTERLESVFWEVKRVRDNSF